MLENYSDRSNTINTKKFKIHKPSCFAYYICCSYDKTLNKLVSYRGSDATEVFIKSLMKDVTQINNLIKNIKPMLQLTEEQQNDYSTSMLCHICKHVLLGDKVRDHDHMTGLYRGAAHSYCNLMFKVCTFIPIIFHNLCGYDLHLFIRELAKYDGSIHIIPKSKEKYITITKSFKSDENDYSVNVKFIDSFQFLNTSLDKLSKSLNVNDFTHTYNYCGSSKQFDLLRRKGVYPYDYMDSFSKYELQYLPFKELFFNSLTKQHISDDDYKHAQKVWNVFNITSTQIYICQVMSYCYVMCLKTSEM